MRGAWTAACALSAACSLLSACGGGSSDGGGPGPAPAPGGSGSAAADYLTAAIYSGLTVEVDFVAGKNPDPPALHRLADVLEERCNKPAGLTVQVDDTVASPGQAPWTVAEITAFEQQHRDRYSDGAEAVLYIAYLDGAFAGDTANSKVLGISYSGSAIAVFKDNIDDAATALITGSVIERALLVHEAGHAMGLVNNGTPLQSAHEDAAHPGHDSNDDCVMYYAIESSQISQLLGTIPDDFDAACIADLQAAGGK